MSSDHLSISHDDFQFEHIQQFIEKPGQAVLSPEAMQAIENCRKYLDEKLADNQHLIYGINTGFGFLQDVRIEESDLQKLQKNLLMSHACGLGEEVPPEIVRLMLLLKVKSLAYGHSGVQSVTVTRLLDMLNASMLPVVYTQGSLGASGDLAPLSHLSLPLIGEGMLHWKGRKMPARQAFEEAGWQTVMLQSKEGLALINGTQFMSAYGMYNLYMGKRLQNWALLIAAMSFEAFDCVTGPFDAPIHAIRPHPGQLWAAGQMRRLLEGSALMGQPKKQVQDPYSFRCIPQVHGASYDAIAYAETVLLREINAVTDNPNVFPDEDLIVSGGNFHGQPLAITADFLCIALSELASISERRTYQLISGQRGLPAFLVKNPGLHSGFMIPQYTAAGIVSENKQTCMPSSVDTIPSSNNQEDHVSMGAHAAVKCKRVADNLEKVLAIELLTAAQALDFRRPGKSTPFVENLHQAFRQYVKFNDADRILHDDMTEAIRFIREQPAAQFGGNFTA